MGKRGQNVKKQQIHKKRVAEKHRLEKKKAGFHENILKRLANDPAMSDYDKYVALYNEAKGKGWRFKEGAEEMLDYDNFAASVWMAKTKAPDLDLPGWQIVSDEQLATHDFSIYQAVMLWNKDAKLVSTYGKMDYEKFRANEKDNFALLRA